MALEKIKIGEKENLKTVAPKVNAAIDAADKAQNDSANAVKTANEAKQKSDSTQTQLDQIVIEGDSSVEAAQARVDSGGTAHTTLKERLDAEHTEVTSLLAQIGENVKSLGAIGDGQSHPLSERFTSLANAQTIYPHATSLNDEIDWCAIQLAINEYNTIIIPESHYIVNKTIVVKTSKQIKTGNRENTIIEQTSDNIPIMDFESWFHSMGDITLKYTRQQLRSQSNAIAITFKNFCHSKFGTLSIFNCNTGIAPKDETVSSWNYTIDGLYVEGFSKTGVLVPKGSGASYGNVYICKPYLTAFSGFETVGGDYVAVTQLNVEGWHDLNDPNGYALGLYEYPILLHGTRLVVNGLSFEAITFASDSGFITTESNGLSTLTSSIIVNQFEAYHIALDSSRITRGAIVYTKQPAFVEINGLHLSVIVKDLKTRSDSDVYNSLLITTTNETRARFNGVTGGNIVGTNDYNGNYGSAGYATNYTYVTNVDSNRGVSLLEVNGTLYSQRIQGNLTVHALSLTNGGVKIPPVPSADPTTLDEYTEADFEPNLSFNGLNVGMTFSKKSGHYTKIGRIVFLTIHLVLSNKGTSTGRAIVSNIPFASTKRHALQASIYNGGTNILGELYAVTKDANSKAIDLDIKVDGGLNPMTDINFTNTSEIIITGFYQI